MTQLLFAFNLRKILSTISLEILSTAGTIICKNKRSFLVIQNKGNTLEKNLIIISQLQKFLC
jgi:hypothetical protein